MSQERVDSAILVIRNAFDELRDCCCAIGVANPGYTAGCVDVESLFEVLERRRCERRNTSCLS